MHEPWDLSDPGEREQAAGEYVLGTLDASQRAALEALLAVSPELQRQVDEWREHLQPFNDQLTPVAPPPGLWPRIARAVGLGPRPWLQRLGLWQTLTAGFAAVALGFAISWGQLPQGPVVPGDAVFVVLDEKQIPGWIISASQEGEIMVQAVQPSAMPAGMGGELWFIADGTPVSLGMLPAHGHARMPMPDALRASLRTADLAVTIEPEKSAPHAEPSGAIIDHGKLIPMQGGTLTF